MGQGIFSPAKVPCPLFFVRFLPPSGTLGPRGSQTANLRTEGGLSRFSERDLKLTKANKAETYTSVGTGLTVRVLPSRGHLNSA